MNGRGPAELTRRALNGAMPPDCLRLQVWRVGEGQVCGDSTMDIQAMGFDEGLAFLVRLRVLAASVELNVLEHLAGRFGHEVANLRATVADVADHSPRPDSVMEVRNAGGDGGRRL